MSTNFNEKQKSILRDGNKVESNHGDYYIDKFSGRKITSNGSTVQDNTGTKLYNPTTQQFKTFAEKEVQKKKNK
ncbi:MAG: hypothetical protein IPN13_17065 [Bacteroidetes bacterium]|nr:hypothetical protein [Bacteroidota bacterium]